MPDDEYFADEAVKAGRQEPRLCKVILPVARINSDIISCRYNHR